MYGAYRLPQAECRKHVRRKAGQASFVAFDPHYGLDATKLYANSAIRTA
jgi:hypothetical protein